MSESAWQPISTAPGGKDVRVITKRGAKFLARWENDIVENEHGACGAWIAVTEKYPASWTDGVCWASNEDGKPSDPPIKWAPR